MHGQLLFSRRNTVGRGHSARNVGLGDHSPIGHGEGVSADQIKTGSAIQDPAHIFLVNGVSEAVGVPENFEA
jgi:hypothetical protein